MWFASLFTRSGRPRAARSKPASRQLRVEALEDRTVPTGVFANTPAILPGGPNGLGSLGGAANGHLASHTRQHGNHVTPINISGAGQLQLNLVTLSGTLAASGQATHLGSWTDAGDFQLVQTGPTTYAATVYVTFTAANSDGQHGPIGRDTLRATVVGTVDFGTGQGTLTYTFTGGTGRFAGATGTATEFAVIQNLVIDGFNATASYTFEVVDGYLTLPGN